MKYFLVLFILISHAWAENMIYSIEKKGLGDGSIVCNNFSVLDKFYAIYKNDCHGKADMCGCLEESRKNNPFVDSALTDEDALNRHRAKAKANYNNNFLEAYESLNYGARFQEKVLGLPSDNIGCTARDINNTFRIKAKEVLEQRKSNVTPKKIAAKKKEIEDCKKQFDGEAPKCRFMEKHLAEMLKLHQQDLPDLVTTACGVAAEHLKSARAPASDSAAVTAPPSMVDMKMALENAKEMLELEIKILNQNPREKKERIAELNELLNIIKSRRDGCPLNIDQVNEQFKKLQAALKSEKALAQKQKDDYINLLEKSNSDLEKTLMDTEKTIGDKIHSLNQESPDKINYCYSFAEYQAIESAPSKELLNALKTSSAADLLDITKAVSPDLAPKRMDFFRKNPFLANLAANPDLRDQLNTAFKSFADASSNKPDLDLKLDYLKFLKSLKPLTNKNIFNKQLLCDKLGENLVAINLGRDLPLQSPETIPNEIAQLASNALYCNIQLYNKEYKNKDGRNIENTLATLESNPLFAVTLKTDLDQELEFKRFNDVNCPDYATFREANCRDLTPEQCRSQSRKDNRLKAAINSLSKSDLKDVVESNKEVNQSKEAKKYYREVVKPKIKPGPLFAETGKEEHFRTQQVSRSTQVAAHQVPPSILSPQSSSSSLGSSTTAPAAPAETKIVDPGWLAPPILSENKVTEASKNPANILPANYPSYPPTKQSAAIKETVEKIKQDAENLLAATSDPKEKEKIKEKVKDIVTGLNEKQQTLNNEKSENRVAAGPSSVQNSIPSAPTMFNGASGSMSPSYSQPKTMSDTKKNSNESYNKALLKTMYAGKDGSQASAGRTPASMPQSDFSISLSPATHETLQGTTVIPPIKLSLSEYQDATSPKDYAVVVESKVAEAFLKYENSSGKSQSNVTLKLYCEENSEKALIVNVSRVNGQLVIKKITEEVISRDKKLKDLVLSLN